MRWGWSGPAAPDGAGMPARPERPGASGGAAPPCRPFAERSLKRSGALFHFHRQAGRLWHISCDEQPELCRQVGDVPAFEAWAPGGAAERYVGRKSTEGLVEFVRLKVELDEQQAILNRA